MLILNEADMVDKDKPAAREPLPLKFNLARTNTPVVLGPGSTLSVPDLSYLGDDLQGIIKRVLEIEIVGAHIEAENDQLNTKLMTPQSRAQFRAFLTAVNASRQVKIDGIPLTQLKVGAPVRSVIGEAQIPRLCDELAKGRLQVDIAIELGVTRAALSKFMQRHGIDLAGNRFDPISETAKAKPQPRLNTVTRAITIEHLRERLVAGDSVAGIGEDIGATAAQIYQQLRRFGINYDGSQYDPTQPRPRLPRKVNLDSKINAVREARLKEICEGLARGETQRAIAARLGTTAANVCAICKRHGIAKDGTRA